MFAAVALMFPLVPSTDILPILVKARVRPLNYLNFCNGRAAWPGGSLRFLTIAATALATLLIALVTSVNLALIVCVLYIGIAIAVQNTR